MAVGSLPRYSRGHLWLRWTLGTAEHGHDANLLRLIRENGGAGVTLELMTSVVLFYLLRYN